MRAMKLKTLATIPILLSIFNAGLVQAAPAHPLSKTDFQSWPWAGVAEFGCFLEKKFGHRDPEFNCSLKSSMNKADPCTEHEAYVAGPTFPKAKVKSVHPLFESIDLHWEHGALQGIDITLKQKLSEDEVRKKLKLKPEASVQQCAKDKTCIVLTGFAPQGAGDVKCEPAS